MRQIHNFSTIPVFPKLPQLGKKHRDMGCKYHYYFYTTYNKHFLEFKEKILFYFRDSKSDDALSVIWYSLYSCTRNDKKSLGAMERYQWLLELMGFIKQLAMKSQEEEKSMVKIMFLLTFCNNSRDLREKIGRCCLDISTSIKFSTDEDKNTLKFIF